MNQHDTAEAISVMMAYVNGDPIQVKIKNTSIWNDIDVSEDETPSWDWNICNYRIKPEPQKFYGVISYKGDAPECFNNFTDADNEFDLKKCFWHGWLYDRPV
jgi:hypothetical protein